MDHFIALILRLKSFEPVSKSKFLPIKHIQVQNSFQKISQCIICVFTKYKN